MVTRSYSDKNIGLAKLKMVSQANDIISEYSEMGYTLPCAKKTR